MTTPLALEAAALQYLAADSNAYIYLLIDSAGLSGLYRKLVKSPSQWANLFENSRESGALAVAPILILVGHSSALEIDKKLLRWIDKSGAQRSIIIMLASPEPIDSVKERLVKRLDVKLSGDMEAVLRFFDPRIFEQLVKILSADQAKKFFGLASQWWFYNRTGSLLGFPAEFIEVDNGDILSLGEDQEFSLLNASEPDQVMYLLSQIAPHLESEIPADRHKFISANISVAAEQGLTSTVDLALYCTVALLCGQNFSELPYWRDGLYNIKARRTTFTELVAGMPEITLG